LLLTFLIPLTSFAFTSVYLLNQNSSDVKYLQQALYDTSYQAQSYVLNADRDMYQAMNAYQTLQLGAANGEAAKVLQQEFLDNVTQVEERVISAQSILLAEESAITEITGQSITELLDRMSVNFSEWAAQASDNIDN